jgi:hypothetical protein
MAHILHCRSPLMACDERHSPELLYSKGEGLRYMKRNYQKRSTLRGKNEM